MFVWEMIGRFDCPFTGDERRPWLKHEKCCMTLFATEAAARKREAKFLEILRGQMQVDEDFPIVVVYRRREVIPE